ncbi:nuclear transport factor 2 family protein [Nocardia sp. NBC_00416]|uniref:nuclear transport factor 2 family protein n=1 Tax=Nocardia sp. NBC_00416 TaxID=2975991 RepID=UPI002E1E50CD
MNDVVATYLRTWNTTDAQVRTALLDQHWAPDASYTDPLAAAVGRAAIGTTIGAVHDQFPGFVFTQVGEPDAHHGQVRFQWGLGPAGTEPVIIGFDVLVTDEQGRIDTVLGFLDKVPG